MNSTFRPLACVVALTFIGSLATMPNAHVQELAPRSLQSLYDQGTAYYRTGDYARAAERFSTAFSLLRSRGQANSIEAGVLALQLGNALARLGAPEAAAYLRLAADALEPGTDAALFVAASLSLLKRIPKEQADDELVTRLLDRSGRVDVSDEIRLHAIEAAVSYFRDRSRDDEADRVFGLVAELRGQSPRASLLRGTALFGRAQAEYRSAKISAAHATLAKALTDLERAGPRATPTRAGALILKCRMMLGDGAYRDALPIAKLAANLFQGETVDLDLWLEAQSTYQALLERLGRADEAASEAATALAWLEERVSPDSHGLMILRLLQVEMLTKAGKLDAASAALTEMESRLDANADWISTASVFQARSISALAHGQFDRADAAAVAAIQIHRANLAKDDMMLLSAMRLRADSAIGLADPAYLDLTHSQLVAMAERLFGPAHPETARDLNVYALTLVERGRLDEARHLLRRVVDVMRFAYGDNDLKFASALGNLAIVEGDTGNTGLATSLFTRALASVASLPDVEEFKITTLGNLANALGNGGAPEQALAMASRAHAMLQATRSLPTVNTDRLNLLVDTATMRSLLQLGEVDDAWAIAQHVLSHAHPATREDGRNLSVTLISYAAIAARHGDREEALDTLRSVSANLRRLGLGTKALDRELATQFISIAWGASARSP